MADTTPGQMLLDKVLAAAKESGYVQKDGTHAQGYGYVTDEATTTKFRNAMIDAGVLCFPEEMEFHDIQVFPHETKAPNVLVSIRGHFAVTDGNASLRVASLGQGIDRGDKAVYKAMTGFKKYGYRHLVMMATGDDPEQSREDEVASTARSGERNRKRSTNGAVSQQGEQADSGNTPATKAQQDELKDLAKQNNLDKNEMTNLRKAHTDKEKSSQFTQADFEAMRKAIIETGKVKAAAGAGAEVVA